MRINLLDYSKGALSGPENRAIEAHLRGCPECAALLEEEVAFASRLAAVPQEMPTSDVWAAVSERTKPKSFFAFPVLARLARTNVCRIAAAAAVVVIAFVLSFRGAQTPPTPAVTQEKAPVVTVQWYDDPIGSETDAMIDAIDNM